MTNITRHAFTVHGMDCASCARTIEQGVQSIPGVATCELHFTSEKLYVTGNVDPARVQERVRALGYTITDLATAAPAAPTAPHAHSFWAFLWQRTNTRFALLGAILILPSSILHELLGYEHRLLDMSALAALLCAGTPIAHSAWRALWHNRAITINLLMTLAALGAVLIGAYTEAGMVIVLFALGEALEGYTGNRARASIQSLLAVMPNTATLLRPATPADPLTADANCAEPCTDKCSSTCGETCSPSASPHEREVPIAALHVGDVILVRPGERIPMDGRIVAGASSVDQAPITGESRMLEKASGDTVFASSINGAGALEIEVTHLAADSTISRVIRMVEEAHEQRAPTRQFIDRFAHYYTPIVVGFAILIASVPPLLFGQPFWNTPAGEQGWFYRALALLVVACPCALVISTPVSLVSAISNAARRGVLFKGGIHLETLNRVQAIAFDKTGTLTLGKPTVIQTYAHSCPAPRLLTTAEACPACDDLLALASSVEQRSEHPLGRAIVAAAHERGLHTRYPSATQVTALVGRGVSGNVQGQQVLLGSHRTFEQQPILHPPAHCAAAHADAAAGYTPVLVSVDQCYRGTITLADTVRPSSAAALAALRQAGIAHLVMLTGDNHHTAAQIGAAVGVTDIHAELLPEAKVAQIRSLQAQYGPVAMVGDGINDAPALAAADVSIALSGQAGGTAQAMETADVVLMRDDLHLLPFAVRLSHATMQTIHANIVFALGSKLIFLILVLLGMGSLWLAVIADMGASILVTLYGMRLLTWQPRTLTQE